MRDSQCLLHHIRTVKYVNYQSFSCSFEYTHYFKLFNDYWQHDTGKRNITITITITHCDKTSNYSDLNGSGSCASVLLILLKLVVFLVVLSDLIMVIIVLTVMAPGR